MKFTAHYINRTTGESYYRTVYGELNEAIKQAEKYTRAGFICVGVKQNMEDNYV